MYGIDTMRAHWIGLLPLLALAQIAQAQSMGPDAGALMQASERHALSMDAPALQALPPEYTPRLRWNDNFSVRVESIQVHGNQLLPDAVLQEALQGFVGKRLFVENVPRLARAVTKAYKDAGYRVRAYVPDQSFEGNHVRIQVIEPVRVR